MLDLGQNFILESHHLLLVATPLIDCPNQSQISATIRNSNRFLGESGKKNSLKQSCL